MTNLSPAQKQEYAFTQKRVLYNNNWDKVPWCEVATKQFFERLQCLQRNQIFEGVRLHMDNATKVLFSDPQLNKLHSIITDIYEGLPMRPDLSFDQAWSALEIAIQLYNSRVWLGKNVNFEVMMRLICTQEIPALFKELPNLKTSIMNLYDIMPLSVGRYVFARCFHHRELGVKSHYGEIQKRMKAILPEGVLEKLQDYYGNCADATFHYKSANEIRKLFQGYEISVGDINLSLSDYGIRTHCFMGCILYTSRNERFHGDNFSHFKSSLTSLKTYAHFYYILIFTYSLLWIVLLRLTAKTGQDKFITADQVIMSIDKNICLYKEAFKLD